MLTKRLSSSSMSPRMPGPNCVDIRSGDNMPPIGRGSNRLDPVSVPLERIAEWSTSLGIPDSNGAVSGSGDDVAPIGRVSNGQHQVSVPLKSIADWSTHLGIPDSNGTVGGSGDDVAPIGRGSFDSTFRIWDAQTGVPVSDPLDRHTDQASWRERGRWAFNLLISVKIKSKQLSTV